MENYLVSARKYRPATFDTVVGQKALTETLKNAIATNRLAHSYLFCGSRGVGKTSCARIFAKTINCTNPKPNGEACDECDSCRAFNNGTSLNIIELDAASNNGVEAMHDLIDQVMVRPGTGRYRVFIVDEVHMLSPAAFNAFLKTLEEPPEYVIFILATTEKNKILPTILSRCQIYDFKRITITDMVNHLSRVAAAEGMTAEREALTVIARKADGAMRDALSIFDQVAASTRGNISYQATIDNLNVLDSEYYNRLMDCFMEGNVAETWMIYKEIRDAGHDSHYFINGLADYMRDLMAARDPRTATLLEATEEVRESLAGRASKCTPAFLLRAMNLLNEADLNYREAANKQFLVELTLAKLCQADGPSPIEDGHGEGQLQPIARPSTGEPATSRGAASPASQAQQPATGTAGQVPTPAATPRPAVTHTAPAAPARPAQGGAPLPRVSAPLPRTGLGPSLSINSRREAAQSAAGGPATTQANVSARTGQYTIEQLNAAWDAFMSANPHAHILVNTMRKARPTPVEGRGDMFRITVENTMQRETMLNAMPTLMKHVHDALGNDMVSVEVEVNQGESTPDTWDERKVLHHMVANNENLRELIDVLKLKL